MTADTSVPSGLRRVSPLSHLAGPLEAGPAEVGLREVPYVAKVNLRADGTGPAAARIASALGAPLPVRPNTVTRGSAADLEILWLGPDEWLVLAPDGAQGRLAGELRAALDGEVGSVVDVSAQQTVIELTGPRAREALAKGCSLDLHPRAFGPGQCAGTLLGRAGVTLLPREGSDPTYWVLVRATFAAYLAEWLLDARREYAAVSRV